ncbi:MULTISPECIES: SRPBCC domain-containing protein [Flavobacterium]|uniref:ATPase n=1 Tax=Flavobacterium panici TaxID=2654843 RepID=A0A9N8J5U9_9FLAO|nr:MULTISPECIES: SRPBCC domain-containing protein [Flavobacterium]UUF15033.1 SRPBCC domain-containing protein [Flavobacterium panici]CAC9976567.1 ATPase [Flavobacterium panici]
MESANNIQNRILQSKILLKAHTDIVWEMWTNPEHISNWWGPNGFTNTIHKMDFEKEGEWNLTMHGPDGKNYPNRSIFKEIIPFKKIVFEHFNPHFITTVLFESENSETLLDWTLLFDSEEMFDIIVKAHKADQGQKENIEKLEKYLSEFISK